MSLRKLSYSDVEILIDRWKNERALWDVTFGNYSNQDERKSALERISQEMDGLDISKSCCISGQKLVLKIRFTKSSFIFLNGSKSPF